MLASWQTHFMTSIVVINSQCVNVFICIYIRPAALNLFRVADHLTNFVSVRGPPKMSTFSEFLTTFLVIFPLNFFSVTLGDGCKILGDGCMDRPLSHPKFWGNRPPDHQKEFSKFSQFPGISQGQGQKKHSIFICNLVVTQSIKRYQVLVHTASSETNLKGGGVNFSSIFLYLQSQ